MSTTKREFGNLTDAEIDALIESDAMTFGGIMGSEFDVKSNLYGDDYADAILADLANIN